jgi:hypothetical protein
MKGFITGFLAMGLGMGFLIILTLAIFEIVEFLRKRHGRNN